MKTKWKKLLGDWGFGLLMVVGVILIPVSGIAFAGMVIGGLWRVITWAGGIE